MPERTSGSGIESVTATYLAGPAMSVWDSIRSHLEGERDRVCGEIRDYPTPIPRCDAQFNHLLEQRDSIARELHHIDSAAAMRDPADAARFIRKLVDESSCLSETAKNELRLLAAAKPPSPI